MRFSFAFWGSVGSQSSRTSIVRHCMKYLSPSRMEHIHQRGRPLVASNCYQAVFWVFNSMGMGFSVWPCPVWVRGRFMYVGPKP